VIRVAKLSDLGVYAAHVEAHLAESGVDGELHYAPVERVGRDEIAAKAEARWRTPLGEGGWGRAFGIVEPVAGDPLSARERFVGHAELRNDPLPARWHRVTFSIGLDRRVRGRGLAEALSRFAIEWLVANTRVEWVDLGVFSDNVKARRLYERLGFEQVGLVRDAFRLTDGTSLDDVLMVKRLR
jgi:RimJ/RimL family protein N-acetyltransferase